MLSALKPMRVSVDSNPLSAAQMGLIGATEDVRIMAQQDPDWEAATVNQETQVSVRLSISNSERQDVLTTHEWLKRVGFRPATFLETVAIKEKMKTNVYKDKLVCVGSLWEIKGNYHYACWHDGEVHLYPIEYSFGSGFVCPIVRDEAFPELPPEITSSLVPA